MSADNLGICPCCESAEEEYLNHTLRENYEIFTDKYGTFYVSYACYCDTCKFQYVFNHEEQLLKE